MSSTVIAKNIQIGADGTASNNFTIFQPASPDGTLRIGNGNTGITSSLVAVTSAGNVGIGTSAPTTKLEVNGTFKATAVSGTTGTFSGAVQASGVATNLYPLVSGTAQASTSGTSIDFTGIPSWVKRITVMFSGVSTNGTSNYLVRIGNTTFTTTGYVSTMTYVNIGANSCTGTTDTTGYILTKDTGAALSFSGVMTICLLSNYVYVAGFNGIGNGGPTFQGGGVLNLGSVLDRLRITTVNGTDTFDAGNINILYE